MARVGAEAALAVVAAEELVEAGVERAAEAMERAAEVMERAAEAMERVVEVMELVGERAMEVTELVELMGVGEAAGAVAVVLAEGDAMLRFKQPGQL